LHRRSAGGRRHIGRPPPSSAALTRSDRRSHRRHPPRLRCRPRSRHARRAAEPIALYVARRLPSLPIQPSSSRKGRWQRRVLAQAALNRPTDRSGEPVLFRLLAFPCSRWPLWIDLAWLSWISGRHRGRSAAFLCPLAAHPVHATRWRPAYWRSRFGSGCLGLQTISRRLYRET